jgi:hypothetical protein
LINVAAADDTPAFEITEEGLAALAEAEAVELGLAAAE